MSQIKGTIMFKAFKIGTARKKKIVSWFKATILRRKICPFCSAVFVGSKVPRFKKKTRA